MNKIYKDKKDDEKLNFVPVFNIQKQLIWDYNKETEQCKLFQQQIEEFILRIWKPLINPWNSNNLLQNKTYLSFGDMINGISLSTKSLQAGIINNTILVVSKFRTLNVF